MTASARCPASCGELIQGWIKGSEKLVSCPINWYSEVSVQQGTPLIDERPNMRKAVIKTLEHFAIDTQMNAELQLTLNSTIPVAKGMASSTADLAATIMAVSRWLNQSITIDEIAKLCISIEPTDSVLFPQLTLFDQLRGKYQQPLGDMPKMDVLILEPEQTLTTAAYRRKHNQSRLIASKEILDIATKKLIAGCENQSPELIGEAATLSAIENQKILPKPGFNKLLQLISKSDLYGITVAHSGTVMGLLLNRERYDPDRFLAQLNFCGITDLYPNQYWAETMSGGVE